MNVRKKWNELLRNYSFQNCWVSGVYILLVVLAALTHSLILMRCPVCFDVPFWYEIVSEFHLVNDYYNLDFLLQVLATLMAGLAIFGAESIRDENGYLKVRSFAKATEIIPLFIVFASVVLLHRSEYRFPYLLLCVVLFLHVIWKFLQLINKRYIKNINLLQERQMFREVLSELVEDDHSEVKSVDEAIGVLEEHTREAYTAIGSGSASELDKAYEFIEIFADFSKEVNNQRQIARICQENISLARSASTIARVDLQQFVARKLFVMMGYGLRVEQNESVNKEMVMTSWSSLSILLWPDVYGNQKINSEPFQAVFELMFKSHIRWYLSYELDGDVTSVTAQTNALIDGCVMISAHAIRNHDYHFVEWFVRLIGSFRDMNIDSETSYIRADRFEKYQHISAIFDSSILHIASLLVLDGLLENVVHERSLTACYEVLAVELGFRSLENAIYVWGYPRKRNTQFYDVIRHAHQRAEGFIIDESVPLELLTTILLLCKVRCWEDVSVHWSKESLSSITSIRQFSESLQNSLTWIEAREPITDRFVEKITREIHDWLFPAIEDLLKFAETQSSHRR